MLGSNMTDFRGDLSWVFVRLLFVRRSSLRPRGICAIPPSDSSIKAVKGAGGRTEGLGWAVSHCGEGGKVGFEKVENRLHSITGRSSTEGLSRRSYCLFRRL